MAVDVHPAGSSPADTPPTAETATDQAVATRDQAAFKLARRAERSASMSSSAPATGAVPAEQVASTDASASVTAPASEPGPGHKGDRKTRTAEIDAEISELKQKLAIRAELQQQLAARPASDAPAASSAAPAATSPTLDLTKPPLTDAEFFAQFPEAAYSEHARYLGRYDRAQERAQDAATQDRAALASRVQAVMVEGTATYPDFEAKLAAADAAGMQWPPDISRYIFAHPKEGAAIAYALVSDPPLVQRLHGLDPLQMGLEVSRLLPKEREASPSSRPFTSAPAPVVTLGRKAVEAADETEAVVASGDMSRFKALKQRERAAQFGR